MAKYRKRVPGFGSHQWVGDYTLMCLSERGRHGFYSIVRADDLLLWG